MWDLNRIYAVDFETDNSEGKGLDPRASVLTSVALAVPGGVYFHEGPEIGVLANLINWLTELPVGLLSSWNGTHFDFPWLITRLLAYRTSEKWTNELDIYATEVRLAPKYELCPGWDHGVGGFIQGHTLFDTAYGYKDYAEHFGVPWKLADVAKQAGIEVKKHDSANLHLLTLEERKEHNTWDALATRQLTIAHLGAHHIEQ